MSSNNEKRKTYRRLPGLRWGASRSILRLADDHLLLCDYRTGFIERYKRFYFKDIEAFIVRRTAVWPIALTSWGACALCFLIISWGNKWNPFLIVVSGICGLGVLLELIRGPSCRTEIRTAVQTDRLRMLKRIRKTERALQALVPLIEAVQGKREITSPPGDLAQGAPVSGSPEATAVSSGGGTVPSPSGANAIPPKLSWVHLILFILVVFTGAAGLWEARFNSTAFVTFLILFGLVAVAGIVAIVRQANHRVHGVAAGMVWVVVIGYVVGGIWVNTAYSFLEHIDLEHTRLFRELSPFKMRQMGGFNYVLWAYGILSLVVGLIGLIFTLMPAPAAAQPPPLPAKEA
jgi:hypothetical protein